MTTPDTPDQAVQTAPATKTPSRSYGPVVAGLLLVAIGSLWFLDVLDVIELRFALVVPAVLAAIGLALIIGAFDGPHTGLVIAGVFVTITTLALAVVPDGVFSGGVGERNIVVADQSELEERYDLGLGEMNLDLSDLDLTSSTTIAASVGAGQLTITLPPDIPVAIEARVGAGEIDLLGEGADGISVDLDHTSDGFDTAPITLTLELSVATGNIKVER
ncbi:MAG: LiaF domain-containing protein [Acidimicrobiia bacterium]